MLEKKIPWILNRCSDFDLKFYLSERGKILTQLEARQTDLWIKRY